MSLGIAFAVMLIALGCALTLVALAWAAEIALDLWRRR